jgi:hypothetical protein
MNWIESWIIRPIWVLCYGRAEIERQVKVEDRFEKRRRSIKEFYESQKETDSKLHRQRMEEMEEQKTRYDGEI